MHSIRLRRVAALLLCSTLVSNLAACGGGDNPTPQTQTAKPTASAGQSSDVKIGQAVKLDGSASKGASPSDKLTYEWVFTSVPQGSHAQFTGAETVSPSFTPDLAGAYAISLVVSSGGVASDPSKITITATKDHENAKPLAKATATPASPKVGDDILLDGSGSSDADGDHLTYKWTLTGPAGSTAKLSDAANAKPKFTADKAGDFTVKLVVNDGQIDSDATTVKITVADNDAKPLASPTSSDALVAPGDTIDLDGTGSTAADPHATLTYKWSIKSKPTASASAFAAADITKDKLSIKLDVEGDYAFELVVNDGHKDSDPADVKVTVAVAPTADIAPVTDAVNNTPITLDGSASKPGHAGDTLKYAWTITGNMQRAHLVDADKVKAKLVAKHAGTYEVQLIVSDGAVDSAPKFLVITVR
jgi:hypothetical protein